MPVSGGPHARGCTGRALKKVAAFLGTAAPGGKKTAAFKTKKSFLMSDQALPRLLSIESLSHFAEKPAILNYYARRMRVRRAHHHYFMSKEKNHV